VTQAKTNEMAVACNTNEEEGKDKSKESRKEKYKI
jgi:hypothetical protein